MRFKTEAIAMKIFFEQRLAALYIAAAICIHTSGMAQVSTGSDGSDGVFNPITNTVITWQTTRMGFTNSCPSTFRTA